MIKNIRSVIEQIETQWKGLHVLVVGDVMLDKYVWGKVERISPEAPVPVVHHTSSTDRPGGAANVAMNIAGLGAKATLIGYAGYDADHDRLVSILSGASVVPDLIQVEGSTIAKLRIIGGSQQIVRLDVEDNRPKPISAERELIDRVALLLPSVSTVIISDYAKGVITDGTARSIIRLCREADTPVLVDPKSRDFSRYAGATTICPNLGELSSATGIPGNDVPALLRAGAAQVENLQLDFLTVTMGEKGIQAVWQDRSLHAPAVARQVYDVSGAGDTVIAVLALCLSSGLDVETAIRLANLAAGVVVGKVGTVPILEHELIAALSDELALASEEKVLTLDRLLTRVALWRQASSKIVFTNGCFDVLCISDLIMLQQCRRMGDRLVVGVSSDASVSALNAPSGLINDEQARAQLLAGLAVVDAVVIFPEPTLLDLVKAIRPDVLMTNGDHSEDPTVGAAEVRSWGGEVRVIHAVHGVSTSDLLGKPK